MVMQLNPSQLKTIEIYFNGKTEPTIIDDAQRIMVRDGWLMIEATEETRAYRLDNIDAYYIWRT